MNTLTAPHGTLAAVHPEPAPVSLARQLVDRGEDLEAGVETLLNEGWDHAELQAATTYVARRRNRMGEGWDDERPTRVLLMLERATARVRPRPPSEPRAVRTSRWLSI